MKWMIFALVNFVCWTRGNEANSIAQKDAEFHDTNHCRKERKAFMTVGFPWDDYYFCAANDIECIRYNFSMQEAVNAPRFHHQWLPI
jgi:gamma-glutamyltranspeptidase/glutathione hydrolase